VIGELAQAVAIVSKAAFDEAREAPRAVRTDAGDGLIVLAGANNSLAALEAGPGAPNARPVDFAKGGKGLKLIWAAFVLDKHHVQTWTVADQRASGRFRFPRKRAAPHSPSSTTICRLPSTADHVAVAGHETLSYQSGDALLAAARGALPDVIPDVLMPASTASKPCVRSPGASARKWSCSGGQTPATIVEGGRRDDYVVSRRSDGVGEVALEAAIRNALERSRSRARCSACARRSGRIRRRAALRSSGKAMQPVMTMVDRVADNDISVLLRGESGVGKEVIAREIHRRSPRRSAPFVKVNCAALPAELLESELFGHERGAFTGAASTRIGKFEFAQHGTIMLDEIGEMPQALQAKILHVLQDREFTKLGSNRTVEVDVRVIAATNRDLEQMMRQGTFREDLYYRLQVIEVHVPPLRERREEIPQLIEFFLLKFASVYHRPAVRPSLVLQDALLSALAGQHRELENMMKRLVVLQDENLILAELGRLRTRAPMPRTRRGGGTDATDPQSIPMSRPWPQFRRAVFDPAQCGRRR
jgi:MoxR-like ATPase